MIDWLAGGRMAGMYLDITELPFPVTDDEPGGWTSAIAGLDGDQIVDRLKAEWSGFQQPYLQALSQAILSRELECLSIDSFGQQWLTFYDPLTPVHIAPPAKLTDQLRSQFPFDAIPGLAEFLEHFAGLVDGRLPPCPWFVPIGQCRTLRSNCDFYDWGLLDGWEGALTLYNTCGGNFIVLSPENVCAKWEHDIGWEQPDENPFEKLGWSMSDLVFQFIAYLSLSEESQKDSPFYY